MNLQFRAIIFCYQITLTNRVSSLIILTLYGNMFLNNLREILFDNYFIYMNQIENWSRRLKQSDQYLYWSVLLSINQLIGLRVIEMYNITTFGHSVWYNGCIINQTNSIFVDRFLRNDPISEVSQTCILGSPTMVPDASITRNRKKPRGIDAFAKVTWTCL